MTGITLTLWTVRGALLAYVAALVWMLVAPQFRPVRHAARIVWTVGCGLVLAHVVCAFQFYHAWSHADAFQHTAEETQRLLGWRFGAGVYFNYLFAAVWIGDCAWWWVRPQSYDTRPRLLGWIVHAYLLLIVFNGAVVFAAGPIRWFGSAACALLVPLWLWRILGRKKRPASSAEIESS